MKIVPVIALAAALIGGGAFAATPSASTSSNAGSAVGATSASTSATSMPSCKQQASAQKLKGAQRESFLKTCKAGRH